MSTAGVRPDDLSPRDAAGGFVPMVYTYDVTSGMTSESLFGRGASADVLGNAPHNLRVIRAWFIMGAAGAGTDAIQLTDKSANAITDDLALSGLGDNDLAHFAEVVDAYSDVTKWSGDIYIVLTDGVTGRLYVECEKRDYT